MPERFRGELLTMGRYINPASSYLLPPTTSIGSILTNSHGSRSLHGVHFFSLSRHHLMLLNQAWITQYFSSQLSPVLNAPTHRGMARLSPVQQMSKTKYNNILLLSCCFLFCSFCPPSSPGTAVEAGCSISVQKHTKIA